MVRVSPSHPYNAGRAQDSDAGVGGTKEMCTLHAGYVVVFVVGKVWRIVPCVYKIYTLDRFQFHGLLKNNPIRCSGGGGVWMYVVRERCVVFLSWLGYPVCVSFGSRLFLFGFRP